MSTETLTWIGVLLAAVMYMTPKAKPVVRLPSAEGEVDPTRWRYSGGYGRGNARPIWSPVVASLKDAWASEWQRSNQLFYACRGSDGACDLDVHSP